MPTQVAARFHSPHAWIEEGMERFLQTVLIDHRSGRKAALDFLDEYREPLVKAEAGGASESRKRHRNKQRRRVQPTTRCSIRTMSSTCAGREASCCGCCATWWAIRRCSRRWPRIIRERTKIRATCRRLLQTSSKRDLEWFFDDWVYRDRGLPDFHVETVYARTLLSEGKSFLVTATIENRGRAGAEVPVLMQTPSGEKVMRVVVKAGEKGTGRIEVPVAPDKVVVNDGSVPEANAPGSNVFDVPPPAKE